LSYLPSDYGIRPTQVKIEKVNKKGYYVAPFSDVFASYIPKDDARDPCPPLEGGTQTETADTGLINKEISPKQTDTSAPPVSVCNGGNLNNINAVSAVSVYIPPI
jgi:hypothetical protein